MNTLNQIINKSIFSSIGTLLDGYGLSLFKMYLDFNKPFIEKFSQAIYAFNGDEKIINLATQSLEKLNTNIKIITTENLGHTFGTFLLDNAIFQTAAQYPEYSYIWKFSNDVITEPFITDREVELADFYYINNIGYISLDWINEPERPKYTKESLLQAVMDKSYFYPQTNYYIIKNHINFYPNKDTIYSLKKEFDEIKSTHPNIHPWHAIHECDSENMLKKTVIQNNLSTHYLLDEQDTKKIIEYVDQTKNYDGSHKNVLYSQLGNLCHLHYPNHPVCVI
jgi:hypothetical protein